VVEEVMMEEVMMEEVMEEEVVEVVEEVAPSQRARERRGATVGRRVSAGRVGC